MNAAVFGPAYSGAYAHLYADKDYEAECDVVERMLRRYRAGRTTSLLDLGCGIGGHALPLASRGYRVTGSDVAPDMLSEARRRAEESGVQVELVEGDLRRLELGRRFDAVLMLFAVLGYQTDNDDVLAALRTARCHLDDGGLLLFDVWYGPAVLTQRPETRTKRVSADGGASLVRTSSSELDVRRSVSTVTFHVERVERGRTVEAFDEVHAMRYFFATELELMLDLAGLALVHLSAFPDIDRVADESTWQVLAVARAA